MEEEVWTVSRNDWEHFLFSKKTRKLLYHHGLLMSDRLTGQHNIKETDEIAKMVWSAYRAGKVLLTQKKRRDLNPKPPEASRTDDRTYQAPYDYFATKVITR